MTAIRESARRRAPAAGALALAPWVAALVVAAGCDIEGFQRKLGAGSAQPGQTASAGPSASVTQLPSGPPKPDPPKAEKKKVAAKPVGTVVPNEDDPLRGKWTLEDATHGLPRGGELLAIIQTERGDIECKLMPDKAPIAVANFIGLARGLRPWHTPQGTWEKKPAYDGTLFHRVRKGFIIQGGDPKGDGTGDAGYSIPDEIWEDANHDRAGLLCMANRGPNTGSAQFFITDGPALHLDGGFTIFGECGPLETIAAIAALDVSKSDRPKSPPVIKKVVVERRSSEPSDGGDAPAASAAASAAGSAASSAAAGPKKKPPVSTPTANPSAGRDGGSPSTSSPAR